MIAKHTTGRGTVDIDGSGLPTPRRRTLASGILPSARSMLPALVSNAGSRDMGSPSRIPQLDE
jgi:hypothetical protein